MPASSPSCMSVTVTLYPFLSPQRMYIRISIEDQSLDSVPPAPELIVRMAPRLSPSDPSIFLSSKSSTSFIAFEYVSSSSCDSGLEAASSASSPRLSLAKSYSTSRSSTSVAALSKDVTHDFMLPRFFKNASAAFGSFQNSGASVFFCNAAACSLFPGMSKTPPQRFHTLMQGLYLFL